MAPSDWRQRRFADVAEIAKESLSTAVLAGCERVRLYSIPAFDDRREPEEVAGANIGSNKFEVPKDCVLLSRLNPRIPRVWRVTHDGACLAASSTEFWPITAAQREVDHDFLAHFLRSSFFLEHPSIRPASTTNSHQRIEQVSVERFTLALPPLAEQRKIAAILSSVDETIEKTEAVIAQLDVVKKAMLKELLTRGIPGRHSRFKQTEIGEVPEEWEVVPFREVVTRGPQNGLYKSKDHYGAGTPMLDMGDIFRSEVVEHRERRRLKVSRKEHETFVLDAGDLLFARRSLVAEGSGQCAVVPSLPEYPVFESSIIRMRPDQDRCDPSFLLHFWNGPVGRQLRMGITRQVAVSGVTGKDLAALPIAVPSMGEQAAIAKAINLVDARIAQEARCASAYRGCKSALTSVLLTGDLRIRTGEAEA